MNDFYQFSPVWKLQLIWFLSLLKSVYIRLLQYVFQKCINFYIFLATSLIIIKGALLMYFCLWHHLRISSRWYMVPSLWFSFYFPLVLFHTILLDYGLIFFLLTSFRVFYYSLLVVVWVLFLYRKGFYGGLSLSRQKYRSLCYTILAPRLTGI